MMINPEYIVLFAKILIASYFIIASLIDIKMWKGSIGLIESKHLPFPQVGLILAILLKIICSISLFFNSTVAFGVLGLAAFILICNFLFNDFWRETGDAKMFSLLRFLSNFALIGGLMLFLVI